MVSPSSFDSAVGRFYSLASLASGDDSAGAPTRCTGRVAWEQTVPGAGAFQDALQSASPDTVCRFATGRVLNVDSSEIVCHGGPPSGIVHMSWRGRF